MNICIVTPRYPYKDNMEFVFVEKLVDEWAKRGHFCVVVTFFPLTTYWRGRIEYKPSIYKYKVSSGNEVVVHNPRIIALGSLAIFGVSVNSWLTSMAFKKLMKSLNIQFDFIYCHFFSSSFYVYKYVRENSIPLFVATGESDIPLIEKPYRGFKLQEYRNYLSGAIAVSSKNKKEAAERGLITLEKCQVFPNGTDLSIFHPIDKNECREKLNLPQDVFIVACVGYVCERKGQNRLLEAVRRLGNKNVKLLFIGKDAKTNTFPLEGNEILFKGSVENIHLPMYLCASDVFCLPTLSEGCCNAIIEALACAIPIISSNLPFNRDVLNEDNSILVDPMNIDEISSAIFKLYQNKEMCTKMSHEALNSASKLSVSQRAASVLDFISENLKQYFISL